jgi:hypothetical protein
LQAKPKIFKKIVGTSNQPIRTNFFQKKYVYYLKSVKEPKICMGATRQNLQAQPKILKKVIGTQNLPIKTKIFLKKLCFVPEKCKGAKKFVWGYPTELAG